MLPASNSNVVQLNNYNVYEHIEGFFKDKGRRSSDETIRSYKRGIKWFFEVVKNRELRFLTVNDVQLTEKDFNKFIDDLMYEEINNKTINKHLSAMKELMRFLYNEEIVQNIRFIEAGRVKNLKTNDNRYGVLSTTEVLELADFARKSNYNGEFKYQYVRLALDTCLRKDALLKIKWTDFDVREDGVIIHAVDKGNKDFRKTISHSFYEELLTLKNESEYVFYPLKISAIDELMKQYKKKFDIPKHRKIVFHSIRKAGVTFQFRIGGILQAQKAAGHVNVNTTQIYLEDVELGAIGAVSSRGKINNNMYAEVEHSILIEAISQCNKDLQMILNIKLNELLKKEEN